MVGDILGYEYGVSERPILCRSGGPGSPAGGCRGALVLVAALAILIPGPARAEYAPGINTRTLTHDAAVRDYDVYAPVGYPGAQPVALVVDIHGFGSDKIGHRGISGWTAKAETEGFLVAHPNGLLNAWNAGVCCGVAVTNAVDDVGFLRAMVEAIVAEGSLDPSRIYVTGLSNGGAMSHRLACEAADLFAAAAPMAFPVPYSDFASQCQPARPIPVLAFMGLSDIVIPYENGFFGGAQPSLAAWRSKNACGVGPLEVQEVYGGSDCQLDTSCAEGVEVGLCSVRGSALAPPFAMYSGHILYFNDDGMVLPDRAWTFFDAIAVPEPGVASLSMAALLTVGVLRACTRKRQNREG